MARLASLAGIAAQIGYKRRPGRYGGKPAVVAANTLDRQFEVNAPDRVRIPEYPAGHSDNIRPPKPGYPATLA